MLGTLLFVSSVVISLVACQYATKATCFMQPDPASSQLVNGTVTFTQACATDLISITVQLQGFSPTLPDGSNSVHGFHIHAYGDISEGCGSTGGHYNPLGENHGAPEDTIRHVGDFGNQPQTADGRMNVTFTDPVASLFGPYSIIGRAVVVHAGVDDLGKGGNPSSLANGNAGSRLACCVIGVAP
ncbi:superoxide dismutase [Cu-Zn] [Plakobranchus ocellatus]|uniref:Superoxide dismutase [Cu-Zn] n=1 Tax=Plakobranchus ocellatus TaxID=259542 RepID=A0AAV4ANF3_9GAST|nr:superoxide dismutase [Cu-Zn] [Plakobranchus ocellatus]